LKCRNLQFIGSYYKKHECCELCPLPILNHYQPFKIWIYHYRNRTLRDISNICILVSTHTNFRQLNKQQNRHKHVRNHIKLRSTRNHIKNINLRNDHLLMFMIPFELYYIITDEHVYMYIVCGRGNQFYGLHVNKTSNAFAALVSIPVKKFFEWEYG
jgi:hypothetical protein